MNEPHTVLLNCLVLGHDVKRIFPIRISPTETVGTLKKLIKEDMKDGLADVDAVNLDLWKVDMLADKALEGRLDNIRAVLDEKESLSPVIDMLDVFGTDGPLPKHLHIIVQVPPSISMGPPPLPTLANVRKVYVTPLKEPPSMGGKPGNFMNIQEHAPIFAQFVDDCQDYELTDDDHPFAAELSDGMCRFYSIEPKRLYEFRNIFDTYGIKLHTGGVGDSQTSTDGHLIHGTHVKVILDGKNEIGSGGAEPFAEAMLYYRKFLEFVDAKMFEDHRAILPCFHIICAGACIGIAGTIFSTKVQSDILAPIIPLFWHYTDLPMQTMAVRTLAAFRAAVKKLEALPTPEPLRGDGTIICPYPRDYVDSAGILQKFTYDKDQPCRDRLIFYGTNTSGARICVKFARMYSHHAHRFCASKGHAPQLIAYKSLPGGWNMIVMDFIDITSFPHRAGSYQRIMLSIPGIQTMQGSIMTLIKELHAEGYVHADLRDANIFVQVREDHEGTAISNFMLVDFDWAGPVGETKYPLGINRRGIYRPVNARGGYKVLPEDDLDMLRALFSVGQKRKRESTPYEDASWNT